MTTVMAKAAPKMAERTGTALGPPPGSRAKPIPATAGGGIPEAAAVRASLDLDVSVLSPRRATRCGARR